MVNVLALIGKKCHEWADARRNDGREMGRLSKNRLNQFILCSVILGLLSSVVILIVFIELRFCKPFERWYNFCLPFWTSTNALSNSAMQAHDNSTDGRLWSPTPAMNERIETMEERQGSGKSNGSTRPSLSR